MIIYSKYWIINRTEFNLSFYSTKNERIAVTSREQDPRQLENYQAKEWFSMEKIRNDRPLLFSVSKCKLQLEDSLPSKVPASIGIITCSLSVSELFKKAIWLSKTSTKSRPTILPSLLPLEKTRYMPLLLLDSSFFF